MKELIQEIDLLVSHIKSDASRSKMVELAVKLIELSKIYWEYKQEYTRLKNRYDNEMVMEKESFRGYFETIYDNQYQSELKENPKAKKAKVTNIECETQAELKLIWLKKEMEETQLNVIYLEPIIRSYYELINTIKFSDRETIRMEQWIRNTDLPF